jgi:hypothetical protein
MKKYRVVTHVLFLGTNSTGWYTVSFKKPYLNEPRVSLQLNFKRESKTKGYG